MIRKLGEFDIISKIKLINPFTSNSYSLIIEEIIKFVKKEKTDSEIFINITGGTNLMSSAALTAAQLLGVNAYYVLKSNNNKGSIINVPILKITLKDALTAKQRHVFKTIQREIKKKGLIKKEKNGKKKSQVSISITEKGINVLNCASVRESISCIMSCLSDNDRIELDRCFRMLRNDAFNWIESESHKICD